MPFPNGSDQTGDTVARIQDPGGIEIPWAVAVEFQIEPDPLMFGRLMVYLGQLWQALKPHSERGSRFNVAAVVVNLTGTGLASRDMRWPDAGFATQLTVLERNLVSENADELMSGVEGGRWSRAVLPWLPLMTGGDDVGIIERWKKAAEAEPDFRRRADYAGLARVFAGAAKRKSVWDKALEGWNVIESEVVNEWKAEQTVVLLISVLETKFGKIPPELEAKIRQNTDLAKLHVWHTQAVQVGTLDEFRASAAL